MAGPWYVDSAAGGTNSGTSANPWASLSSATAGNGVAAGDIIYISERHAENNGGTVAITCTLPGTNAAPNQLLCTDHTKWPTPGSGDLKKTATITTTGTFAITMNGSIYCYGVIFQNGSGAGNVSLQLGTGGDEQTYEGCAFQILLTNVAGRVVAGLNSSGLQQWINTTVQFSNASQSIATAVSRFIWRNTASAVVAGTLPTNLVVGNASRACIMLLEGMDFSALTSGKNIVGAVANGALIATLKDCKIASGANPGITPSGPYAITYVTRTDSAGTNYIEQIYDYAGTMVDETTIVRTGGSSVPKSRKITTVATNTSWLFPFQATPIARWNPTIATNVNVTMFGICQLATIPNNDDTWFDVEYLGASGTPLGSFATGSKADVLASGSPLTADSTSDWTSLAAAYQTAHTYGAFTGVIKAGNASPQQLWFMFSHSNSGISGSDPTIFNGQADGAQVTDNSGANQIVWQAMTRFKLTVTLGSSPIWGVGGGASPQPGQAGYLYAYLKAAKSGVVTYWWDPVPVLS